MMNYAKTKAVRTFLILGVAVVFVFALGIEPTFSARPGSSRLHVQAVLRAGVTAIPVPHPFLVSVTDEAGSAITDLTQTDFEFRVFSDVCLTGEVATVTSFHNELNGGYFVAADLLGVPAPCVWFGPNLVQVIVQDVQEKQTRNGQTVVADQ